MATKKTQKIKITNTGPIRNFEAELPPGVSVAYGANGVGKTHLIAALTKSLGGDPEIPLAATDGASKGSVIINDIPILAITKLNRQTGKADVSLLSASPLGTLVDPDIADPVRAENARLKALLQMVDCPVTEKTLHTLVGDDTEAVMELAPDDLLHRDIVSVADLVRRTMHNTKRHFEQTALRAAGEAAGAKVETPAVVSRVSVADAQAASDESLMNLQRLTGEASQRAAREQERAEIEATLGERPDVVLAQGGFDNAVAGLKEAQSARDEIGRNFARLQEDLLFEKARFAAADVAVSQMEDRRNDAALGIQTQERLAGQWDQRRAILDSEITGATAADVEAAKTTVLERRTALELARQSEAYRHSLEAVADARKRQQAAENKAAHFEKIALTVTSRLGEVLASTGVQGLTVDDGTLSVLRPDGTIEAFSRLSFGQRTRIAADLIAKRAPEGTILPLADKFWHGLDDANKGEFHQIFAERGISVITESADVGELRVRAFEAAK